MLRNKVGLALALMGLASLAAAALSAQTFTNGTAIAIPSGPGSATPYPSNIAVSGLAGNPSAISVTLTGFGHTWSDDVDVLLVGPGGASVVLMSDCGGSSSVSGVNITFNNVSATPLTGAAITTGTYMPTNIAQGADAYAAPAPAGPYGANFANFLTQSPNGTWSLYVVDDTAGDSGSFAGGWSLTLTVPTTAPTITSTAPTTAFVGQLYTYTVTATGNPAVTFSVAGNPAWLSLAGAVLSGTPAAGDIGTAGPITITATNGVAPDDTEVFSITVAASAPEIDVTDPDTVTLATPQAYTVYGAVAATALNGTFTVNNIGNVGLNVTAMTVTAQVNCGVVATPGNALPYSVPASGNTTMGVALTPTAAGNFSFTITIASADADEANFVINFTGNAPAAAGPEIAVRYLTADVANGSTLTQANTGVVTFNRPYTVRNEGANTLTLSGGPVVVSLSVNCTVVVTQPGSSTLGGATWNPTTDTFNLAITPTAAGQFSFTVTIANDDTNENPFVFNFVGHTASFPNNGGGDDDDKKCSTGTNDSASWMLLVGLLASMAVAFRLQRSRA